MPKWLPWGIAVLAAAAVVVLSTVVWTQSTRIARLEADKASQPAPETRPPVASTDRTAAPPSKTAHEDPRAGPAPSAVSPEVLEAAVERELADRAEAMLADRKHEANRHHFEALAARVDALIDQGRLTDADAEHVEGLLADEMVETWAIKTAVVRGELTEAEGVSDWKGLVADTDEALLEIVDEAVLTELRNSASK